MGQKHDVGNSTTGIGMAVMIIQIIKTIALLFILTHENNITGRIWFAVVDTHCLL